MHGQAAQFQVPPLSRFQVEGKVEGGRWGQGLGGGVLHNKFRMHTAAMATA